MDGSYFVSYSLITSLEMFWLHVEKVFVLTELKVQ